MGKVVDLQLRTFAQSYAEQCCLVPGGQKRCPYKADYVIQNASLGLDFRFCNKHVSAYVRPGQKLTPFKVYVEEQKQERSKLIRKEVKRVEYHNLMAEKYALPATLVIEQWVKTLDRFSWRCAYCHRKPYAVLEHFLPLIHGGGTTAYNCIPACNACNAIKSDAHPQTFEGKFPQELITDLKSYLSQQWESEVVG